MDTQINQRNIIISKHAIQRREHYTPIDKDILINLVKQIDDKFAISKKENNIYKIGHKNTIAIIKKADDALILITAYFFDRYDYKIDNINLKISIAVSKEDRKLKRDMNRGMIHKIYRINFLNKKVECGVICATVNSKNSRDKIQKENFKYKLILDWKLFLKFQDIPMNHYHMYFNDFEEILNVVHLENEDFFLNNFERK
ncbi:hypothetical protein [Arcobacter aquimarinus]|uniref:Uncharacterized protein n=1 Tax=Arcobacter aquimarinus TaxID=1315211 RepID=A0AAE7E1D2_9BACT|nr:hypothetical protein [Arcobacter aquimarinus]QKE26004.1 hypothetical protein AAQM_1253 [Arcobacter aquimarinus]RXI36628.1 hypothetical protein CP986_01385 [Arcobacter aquimarinus]